MDHNWQYCGGGNHQCTQCLKFGALYPQAKCETQYQSSCCGGYAGVDNNRAEPDEKIKMQLGHYLVVGS